MFKKASQMKLRFLTSKGLLTTEQLWDLSQTDLANAIKDVKKVLKKTDDDELLFLNDNSLVDTENQLKFDILKEVYLTKKADAEERKTALEAKARKQKILELIAEKKEESLKNLTVEELEAMIK